MRGSPYRYEVQCRCYFMSAFYEREIWEAVCNAVTLQDAVRWIVEDYPTERLRVVDSVSGEVVWTADLLLQAKTNWMKEGF